VVPVLLRVLGAEHGSDGVIAALEEYHEHAAGALVGAIRWTTGSTSDSVGVCCPASD
jgi:hypothetical protein